jgi:uncharacterized RDD family membrane protein YckC
MKCPKCGYLGFEDVERCRNCGYDFSLTSKAESIELPLKNDETRPFLDDLRFLDDDLAPEPVRAAGARGPQEVAAGQGFASASPELPLFGASSPDDLPLITRPSAPRPPLAVRRATPDVQRLRSAPTRAANLDLALEPVVRGQARPMNETPSPSDQDGVDATVGARFVAVVTDLLILAAIDAAVVYFTMQICGIGIDELEILPRAPLFAFLLIQNGGYLVAFTAGGQTLGKMLAGIKVVSTEPRSSLDLGHAFVRELVWLVLAVPAGLGLLTVLSRDRRGVHDRFAGTRVIRASLV